MTEIKGVIKEIDDCGTIMDITVTDKDNHDHSVLIDHRMFTQMVEDRDSIIGKLVIYDDANKSITFKEDQC